MNCPNCGSKLNKTDQKYCEYCGNELVFVNNRNSREVKIESKLNRSKRRCC